MSADRSLIARSVTAVGRRLRREAEQVRLTGVARRAARPGTAAPRDAVMRGEVRHEAEVEMTAVAALTLVAVRVRREVGHPGAVETVAAKADPHSAEIRGLLAADGRRLAETQDLEAKDARRSVEGRGLVVAIGHLQAATRGHEVVSGRHSLPGRGPEAARVPAAIEKSASAT
jgi:hypothetical protein